MTLEPAGVTFYAMARHSMVPKTTLNSAHLMIHSSPDYGMIDKLSQWDRV